MKIMMFKLLVVKGFLCKLPSAAAAMALLFSGACAMYELPSEVAAMKAEIPFYDASALPTAASSGGVALAARVAGRDEQVKLLSESLPGKYLPVIIYATNNGDKRVLLDSVALKADGFRHAPLSAYQVSRRLQGHFWLTMRMFFLPEACIWEAMNEKQRRDEAATIAVYEKLLRPTIINPRQTIIGFVFLDKRKVGHHGATVEATFQNLDRMSFFNIVAPLEIRGR